MYWYKLSAKHTTLLSGLILLISGMSSCKPDIRETGTALKYFDLKKFISADSARLTKAHVMITKTVVHNNSDAQTQKLAIDNWGRELNLFSASDINKPAWRESYNIQQSADSIVYSAKTPELVTRRMVIQKDGDQVKKIVIDNFAKNILYQTTEKLVYFPDSLYIIDKTQKVKLMGSNRYLIKGAIK